jgi:predicted Zn-dependent protease
MPETIDSDDESTDWERARQELRRGYMLVSFGQFEPAIEACRRADELVDGEHHLPRTLEGNALVARGDLREAIGVLREVTQNFPQAALPQMHFAEACYLAGRKRQADRALDRAGELDDGEHADFLEALQTTWRDVDADEIPPPIEIE